MRRRVCVVLSTYIIRVMMTAAYGMEILSTRIYQSAVLKSTAVVHGQINETFCYEKRKI